MRNTLRLLIPCLLLIGACSHSGRPATTAAAAAPQRSSARPAPMRAEAPARVPTGAEAPAALPTRAEAPMRATRRMDAIATHSFAPAAQSERPEEACGAARVRFVSGSSELDAAARGRLDAYASCMVSDPANAVYISGTGDPGSDARGIGLAGERARAVADYLHQGGLHMAFEVRAYRAGVVGPVPAERQIERSATVTTVSPQRQGH